ncbi:MAG: hypothetical protein PHO42_03865 [Candidatus Omnitrophica bacterium]|nr:hypothetical protein [Candidatus Omnitrophota bacterium]
MKLLSNVGVKYLVVLALLLNITGCATPYKMHPEFKERHKNIASAALMAPEVDAYVLTFQGDKKRLDDLSAKMEGVTIGAIEKIFSEKGYIIKK